VARLEIDTSVLMNGITTGTLKSDFKTRAVRLDLKPIYAKRMSDSEIAEALQSSHAEILGCLLQVTCDVLRLLPDIVVPEPQPRMIDYARVLTAYVCEIANRWLRDALNGAKVDDHIKHMTHEKRGMFETGEILTAAIRKAEPDWKRLGVQVEKLGQLKRHGQRDSYFRFSFIPRGDATPWNSPTSVVRELSTVS
jgi:hypothetical protein